MPAEGMNSPRIINAIFVLVNGIRGLRTHRYLHEPQTCIPCYL